MDMGRPSHATIYVGSRIAGEQIEELKQIIVTTLQLFTNWIWDIIMCCKKCTVQFKHYVQNTVIKELKTY